MTTYSPYGTRIEGDRVVCACPDTMYRQGGSYRAISPDGEVQNCCKHGAQIYRVYGWTVDRRPREARPRRMSPADYAMCMDMTACMQ